MTLSIPWYKIFIVIAVGSLKPNGYGITIAPVDVPCTTLTDVSLISPGFIEILSRDDAGTYHISLTVAVPPHTPEHVIATTHITTPGNCAPNGCFTLEHVIEASMLVDIMPETREDIYGRSIIDAIAITATATATRSREETGSDIALSLMANP